MAAGTTSRATKKTTSPELEKAAVQKREIKPTREDAMQAMLWTAQHTPLIPIAWGPTATGKTYGWSHLDGWDLITVLAAQHTPDEIAGFQAIVNGRLEEQLPYWFRHAQEQLELGRKVVILFDEISLARDEVKGALYTFFRDRHLHGHKLQGTDENGMNPNVMVVGATNPGVLAPPFMSRAILFPIPADREYLLAMAKNSQAKRVAADGPISDDTDPSWSNQAPPQMLTVHAATIDTMNRMDKSFYALTDGAQHLILQGLLPQSVYEQLQRERVDMTALLQYPEEISKHIQQLDAPDAVALSLELLETLDEHTPKDRAIIMFHILDGMWRGSEEHVEAYFATEKSPRVVSAVEGLDAAHLNDMLVKSGVLGFKEENGQMVLHGPWVDPYIAAAEAAGAK